MTKREDRNTKLRKIFHRTAKGRHIRYVREKTECAGCAVCGKKLAGVCTKRSLSLSAKRPGRLFSGMLCQECVTTILKQRTRLANSEITPQDIEVRYSKYLGLK